MEKTQKRKVQLRLKIPFGKNITNRPKEPDNRLEFGHWEMDTVESSRKSGTACLLNLIGRKHRFSFIFKLRSQTQKEAHRVLDSLERELGAEEFTQTFKTISVDNGGSF